MIHQSHTSIWYICDIPPSRIFQLTVSVQSTISPASDGGGICSTDQHSLFYYSRYFYLSNHASEILDFQMSERFLIFLASWLHTGRQEITWLVAAWSANTYRRGWEMDGSLGALRCLFFWIVLLLLFPFLFSWKRQEIDLFCDWGLSIHLLLFLFLSPHPSYLLLLLLRPWGGGEERER